MGSAGLSFLTLRSKLLNSAPHFRKHFQDAGTGSTPRFIPEVPMPGASSYWGALCVDVIQKAVGGRWGGRWQERQMARQAGSL